MRKHRRAEDGVVSTEYVLMLVVVAAIVAGLLVALNRWGVTDHLVALVERALQDPT